MNTPTKTILLGAALAGLTMSLSGCAEKAAEAKEGECYGVNACKGKGECSGKGHACAGGNACKGQGWIAAMPQDCEARHGTFKPMGSGDKETLEMMRHQHPTEKDGAAKSDGKKSEKSDATKSEATKPDAKASSKEAPDIKDGKAAPQAELQMDVKPDAKDGKTVADVRDKAVSKASESPSAQTDDKSAGPAAPAEGKTDAKPDDAAAPKHGH